jgi:hypothetical protein
MVKSSRAPEIHLKPGIYVGAAVTALLLLLPYVNVVFVPAYILGPLAGVWFELRRRERRLDFTQGALLGFYSTFYGTIAADVFSRVAVRIVHEQLWRFENIYLLWPLLASKGLDSDTPHGWYLLMFQLTFIAILAGAIGSPSGLLGVKLFQRSRS